MIETVAVHNLEVLCKIGIWEWEQGTLQKVQLDLELGFDFGKVIASRRLEDTIDYGDLVRRVESLLQGKNFGYLEVVVERVTDLVFETYPASSFEIRLRKLSRELPSAAWVGVMRKISRLEWEHRRRARAPAIELPQPSAAARDLVGRVALVTGSARRLGRGIAEHLAARGASVAVHYKTSRDEAEALAHTLRGLHPGARFETFRADLADQAQVVGLAQAVAERVGPVDVLVNNVGHYVPKGILDVDASEWNETIRVNLDAVFHLTRAVVDASIAARRGWGRVINIGHAGSDEVLARPASSAYHVSKTALALLTRTFADACGPHGITVNLLNPGVLDISVDLPITAEDIPLRRLGTVDDVVAGLAYLTSPEASYVTGTALDVSGGYGLAGRP
ncbi:MAG: SDR family oxidoreductase [Deltaproteobacteria bacterium]|nr:SDR family oxidoreductase [Deltaproteobacteria bacterium]